MITVPDFFQDESEEALRAQVKWQKEHLGLADTFFAGLLREDQSQFSSWVGGTGPLTSGKEDLLRDWWRTVLHLLSFQYFMEDRVRALLERTAATGSELASQQFAPPWSTGSLKAYLENRGPDAIAEVNRWVESFRFGNPYAQPPKGRSCLSTQP